MKPIIPLLFALLIWEASASCTATIKSVADSPWAVYEKDRLAAESSNPTVTYTMAELFDITGFVTADCEAVCSVSYKWNYPYKADTSGCPLVMGTNIVNEAAKDETMQFSFEIDRGFEGSCDDSDKSYFQKWEVACQINQKLDSTKIGEASLQITVVKYNDDNEDYRRQFPSEKNKYPYFYREVEKGSGTELFVIADIVAALFKFEGHSGTPSIDVFADHQDDFDPDDKMDSGNEDGFVRYDGTNLVIDKTEDENSDRSVYLAIMPDQGSVILTKVKFQIIVSATKCNVNSISAKDGGSQVSKIYYKEASATTLSLEDFFTYNFQGVSATLSSCPQTSTFQLCTDSGCGSSYTYPQLSLSSGTLTIQRATAFHEVSFFVKIDDTNGQTQTREFAIEVCGLETVTHSPTDQSMTVYYLVGASATIPVSQFASNFSSSVASCPVHTYYGADATGATNSIVAYNSGSSQIEISTTSQFYMTEYRVYAQTQAGITAFFKLNVEVIDCSLQTVNVQNPAYKVQMQLSINSTDLASVSLAEKFVSSHPLLCPITKYEILKVVDAGSGRKIDDYESKIAFGTATDPKSDSYFANLLLNDTTQELGPYQVFVRARSSAVQSSYDSYVATIEVLPPPNFPPEFTSPLRSVIVLDWAGEKLYQTYTLPEGVDKNGHEVTLSVSGQEKASFITYRRSEQKLIFDKYTEEDEGRYPISVKLTDSEGLSFSATINVDVLRLTGPEPVEEEETIVVEVVEEPRGEYPKQTAEILEINKFGLVTVDFTQDLKEPSHIVVNSDDIEIKLSEFEPNLKPELMTFTWKVEEVRSRQIDLKLNFTNPIYISPYPLPDWIKIKFNNKEMFGSRFPLEDSSEVIMAPIGKQIPDTAGTRALEQTSEVADTIMMWSFILSLVINLIFSNLGTMEYTLIMINSLQMIVHLPILQVMIPGNMMMFLQIILPIVMFDILDPLEHFGVKIENLFNFDVLTRREQRLEILNQMRDLGYETHNSMINLSSLSLALLVYFMRVIILCGASLVLKFSKRYGESFVESQKKSLFFNDILILALEGYLEFLICGYLNLQQPLLDTSFSAERLSLFMSLFCFATALMLPFVFCAALFYFSKDDFSAEQFKQKYGVLTEGVQTSSKITLSYFLIFMIRRLLFFLIAFALSSAPSLQVIFVLYLTVGCQIYLVYFRPRKPRFLNKIEIVNETFIYLVTLHLILFTDYIPDVEISYDMGISAVIFTGITIMYNLSFVFYHGGRSIHLIYQKLHQLVKFRYFPPLPPSPKIEEILSECSADSFVTMETAPILKKASYIPPATPEAKVKEPLFKWKPKEEAVIPDFENKDLAEKVTKIWTDFLDPKSMGLKKKKKDEEEVILPTPPHIQKAFDSIYRRGSPRFGPLSPQQRSQIAAKFQRQKRASTSKAVISPINEQSPPKLQPPPTASRKTSSKQQPQDPPPEKAKKPPLPFQPKIKPQASIMKSRQSPTKTTPKSSATRSNSKSKPQKENKAKKGTPPKQTKKKGSSKGKTTKKAKKPARLEEPIPGTLYNNFKLELTQLEQTPEEYRREQSAALEQALAQQAAPDMQKFESQTPSIQTRTLPRTQTRLLDDSSSQGSEPEAVERPIDPPQGLSMFDRPPSLSMMSEVQVESVSVATPTSPVIVLPNVPPKHEGPLQKAPLEDASQQPRKPPSRSGSQSQDPPLDPPQDPQSPPGLEPQATKPSEPILLDPNKLSDKEEIAESKKDPQEDASLVSEPVEDEEEGKSEKAGTDALEGQPQNAESEDSEGSAELRVEEGPAAEPETKKEEDRDNYEEGKSKEEDQEPAGSRKVSAGPSHDRRSSEEIKEDENGSQQEEQLSRSVAASHENDQVKNSASEEPQEVKEAPAEENNLEEDSCWADVQESDESEESDEEDESESSDEEESPSDPDKSNRKEQSPFESQPQSPAINPPARDETENGQDAEEEKGPALALKETPESQVNRINSFTLGPVEDASREESMPPHLEENTEPTFENEFYQADFDPTLSEKDEDKQGSGLLKKVKPEGEEPVIKSPTGTSQEESSSNDLIEDNYSDDRLELPKSPSTPLEVIKKKADNPFEESPPKSEEQKSYSPHARIRNDSFSRSEGADALESEEQYAESSALEPSSFRKNAELEEEKKDQSQISNKQDQPEPSRLQDYKNLNSKDTSELDSSLEQELKDFIDMYFEDEPPVEEALNLPPILNKVQSIGIKSTDSRSEIISYVVESSENTSQKKSSDGIKSSLVTQ